MPRERAGLTVAREDNNTSVSAALSSMRETVRLVRAQRHLSQREAAIQIGIGYAELSRFETDQLDPRLTTIQKIADWLDADAAPAPEPDPLLRCVQEAMDNWRRAFDGAEVTGPTMAEHIAAVLRDNGLAREHRDVKDRILWNERPKGYVGGGGDIDEIVLHDVDVHIEQMTDHCWWIGIYRGEQRWAGNFSCDKHKDGMTFSEQENELEFDEDKEHRP